MGGAGGGPSGDRRPRALDGRRARHRQGAGRLPLSRGHDGPVRGGAAGGALRSPGRERRPFRPGIVPAPFRAGLWGGGAGDGLSLQRRDGGGADARRLCGGAGRRGAAAALSLRLRLHRQRRELRAADFQPCQSRGLRRQAAGVADVDRPVRSGLAGRHPRHLSGPAPRLRRRFAPQARDACAPCAAVEGRARRRLGAGGGRGRATGRLGHGRPVGRPDPCGGPRHRWRGAGCRREGAAGAGAGA